MTLPRRIALITANDPRGAGGVERSCLRIATGIAARHGVEVDVVALEPRTVSGAPAGECEQRSRPAAGVTLLSAGSWSGAADYAGQAADAHAALVALLREGAHGLLHALPVGPAAFHAVYAAAQLELPVLVSARGSDIARDPFEPRGFAQQLWALQRATHVTALTREGARDIRALAPRATEPEVIPNSVVPEAYDEGTAELGPGLGRPVVGAVGVFRPTKGTRFLLAAFEQILERLPGATLLLVGDMRTGEPERIEDMVSAPEIARRIVVTGLVPRREVLRYVRAMDVFVSASIRDACPNAVLEAIVARRPIVATRVGAVADMLRDGELGALVEPGSVAALRDAVLETLAAEGGRIGERVALAARAAAEDWSLDTEIAGWTRAYERCLELHATAARPLTPAYHSLDGARREDSGASR